MDQVALIAKDWRAAADALADENTIPPLNKARMASAAKLAQAIHDLCADCKKDITVMDEYPETRWALILDQNQRVQGIFMDTYSGSKVCLEYVLTHPQNLLPNPQVTGVGKAAIVAVILRSLSDGLTGEVCLTPTEAAAGYYAELGFQPKEAPTHPGELVLKPHEAQNFLKAHAYSLA
jgi:hypothetical protein